MEQIPVDAVRAGPLLEDYLEVVLYFRHEPHGGPLVGYGKCFAPVCRDIQHLRHDCSILTVPFRSVAAE